MQLFDVAFGRDLYAELPKIINPPFLVVSNKDLWPKFSHHFDDKETFVHLVDSLEIKDLEKTLKELPDVKAIVGMGGGVAIDVAKYFAWRKNLPLFQCPTSMSVNAPFGHRSAVRDNGILKYVGYAIPEMVYVDYDVIQSAPEYINRSGVGDIVCYYTAKWDWEYATKVGKCEKKWPYDEYWVGQASEVLNSVLNATSDIKAVNDRGVQTLMNALQWGGAAFNNAGWNPRPIEGSEHTLFYSLEHLIHKPFLHGQIVSLGVVIMSFLQNNDPKFIKNKLDEMGVAYQPEDMDITWTDVRNGLRHMVAYSKESKNLWYTIATETQISEKQLDEIEEWVKG